MPVDASVGLASKAAGRLRTSKAVRVCLDSQPMCPAPEGPGDESFLLAFLLTGLV